jgi:hypothetical protein
LHCKVWLAAKRSWHLKFTAPVEGHQYISPSNIIQRPKVAYSSQTEDYHVRMRSTYHL